MISHAKSGGGGQMTNSPPSNVRKDENDLSRVLCCGYDRLDLGLYVNWSDTAIFDKLAELKQAAKGEDHEFATVLTLGDESGCVIGRVLPNGSRGYEWIYASGEFAFLIARQSKAPDIMQRSNLRVNIFSEPLWTHGDQACLDRVVRIIQSQGGEVVAIKPSRVDMTADLLLPSRVLSPRMRRQYVTRATSYNPHYKRHKMTGISVGKGKLLARLYNKVREIIDKGGSKGWFYEVWGLDEIPDGYIVLRNEFQLRREALKELGVESWEDLQEKAVEHWGYMTQHWLRMAEDNRKHTRRQKLLPWWEMLQGAFTGGQLPVPSIRKKAMRCDRQRLAKQAIGALASMQAIDLDGRLVPKGDELDMRSNLHRMIDQAITYANMSDKDYTERVKRKQAKYTRSAENFQQPTGAGPMMKVSYDHHQSSGHPS